MFEIRRSDFFNIVLVIVMLLFNNTVFLMDIVVNNSYYYLTVLSFVTLVYQLVSLRKKYNIKLINTLSFFLVLSHVFNFGNFYLKAFSKEQYYIFFSDWFTGDIQGKAKTGFWALAMIQALYTGICLYLSRGDFAYSDFRMCWDKDEESINKAIHFAGLVMLVISLPCRLYWDINQVLLGQASNGYIGGFSQSGLIDDIAVLFAPALICIMYATRKEKRKCKIIFLNYMIYTVIIMTLSGARRAYITSLLAMFVFYYETFMNTQDKERKRGVLSFILIVLIGIITLNFMTLIRDFRHSGLSFANILTDHLADLLSLDFFWNIFGEFGLTGIPLYYAHQIFPTEVPFYYGMNAVMSIVFILPIGWLLKYKFATTRLMEQIHSHGIYTHTGLGSSLLCELYSDFGYLTPLFAIMTGYFIASFGATNGGINGTSNVKLVMRYCLSIVIINYARGSTSEIFRNGGYVIIAVYCLVNIYFSLNKNNTQDNDLSEF